MACMLDSKHSSWISGSPFSVGLGDANRDLTRLTSVRLNPSCEQIGRCVTSSDAYLVTREVMASREQREEIGRNANRIAMLDQRLRNMFQMKRIAYYQIYHARRR